MEEIKFYEIANILDLDLEYDGDKTDLRLHGREKLNWGAETFAAYEEATNAIDAISYKGNGWEVYATYDVSGFDYWMLQQEEQNYITMTIMFDANNVDATEIPAIKNAMDMAYSDAYSIAEKYDYVPNSEYKRGGSLGYDIIGGARTVNELSVPELESQLKMTKSNETERIKLIKKLIEQKSNKYAEGSTIKGDKNIGKIIQMRKTADWFKVVTKRNDEDLYGKKKPNYTIIDVSKLKNGKIIANINHTEIEGFNDWSSKYEMVNSLPIKYKQAFDKLTDEYNVYAEGGGVEDDTQDKIDELYVYVINEADADELEERGITKDDLYLPDEQLKEKVLKSYGWILDENDVNGEYYLRQRVLQSYYDIFSNEDEYAEGGGVGEWAVQISYASPKKIGWASFDIFNIVVSANSPDLAEKKAMMQFNKIHSGKKGKVVSVINKNDKSFDNYKLETGGDLENPYSKGGYSKKELEKLIKEGKIRRYSMEETDKFGLIDTDYDIINELEKEVDNEEYKRGGKVDGRSTRAKDTWNRGSAWTRDRNAHNKSEDWEKPLNQRGKSVAKSSSSASSKSSSSASSKGKSKNYSYIPNYMIRGAEVNNSGKTTDIDGANILDGIYVKKGTKYAEGGGVGYKNKYNLRGWRKSKKSWVIINKNPMSYEEGQKMFEDARKSGLYDTLSIESNMLKNPNYATFSINERGGSIGGMYAEGGGVPDLDKKMALINLDMIHEYSVKLDNIVTEETELEEWVKMKLTRIEQNVADVKHAVSGGEKFDGGGMIFKKQLLHISKYAKELIDMLQSGSNLMGWQENKLAIAADNIDGIYHYMDYNRAKDLDKKDMLGFEGTLDALGKLKNGGEVRMYEILDEVEDYSEINKNDIPKILAQESFEKGLDDDEIQTKINKHLIKLGYNYDSNEYKWKNANFANGGVPRNVGRDWIFKSKQKWEQDYDRKREYKEYKKEGWLANWFKEGGEAKDFDFDEFRKRQAIISEAVKFAFVRAVGFDDAYNLLQNEDLSISPYRLVERAVSGEFIGVHEINKDVVESAIDEARRVTGRYKDSGQGIGSSDMTAFLKNFLDDAGFKTAFISSRLERIDENGNAIKVKSDLPNTTMFKDGGEANSGYTPMGRVGETKENWNNASYGEKLKWLKTRTELYPEKGDIFDMADVYARTQYHLLPNNVHIAITESQKFAKGGRVKNYKYVPNHMIESVDVERNGKTTEIDGGNILDGLYVKGKVNFEEGGYVENIPTETLEAMIGRKLNGWNDDKVIFNGIVYKKCFMKPYYKIA